MLTCETERGCFVRTPADLDVVFDPHPLVVAWLREPDPVIGEYVARMAASLYPVPRCVVAPGESIPLHALPDFPGRAALRDDIAMLTELMADVVDCPKVGLRLECLDRPMCPRFHVDRVTLRLLCVYAGEGTQWVDCDLPSDVTEESPVQSLPLQAVALCKGTLWPGNANRAFVHRSAPVADAQSRRVLLALDGVW